MTGLPPGRLILLGKREGLKKNPLERESTRGIRVVREACQVRRLAEDSTMNRDDGGYELSHIWDPLLKAPTPSKRRTRAHQPRS